jgi:outer membrane protein TolC
VRAGARTRVVALALATVVAPRAGARTLNRREAVRAALAQNPRIAAARAEEAVLEAQRQQVDAARWPIVTLDAGVGPSLTATLVPGTAVQSVEPQYGSPRLGDLSATFAANLSVIQPLYTFGKIATRQEATAHGRRAREAQTRMERADVAFEVARIYEGYLLARDADRFLTETIHWLQSTLESTQERLARGAAGVTERDVLRLQAGMGLAEMGLHQARAGEAQAMAGLAAYLGMPADEPITTAEEELGPVGRVPKDFASVASLALEKRPEIVALREGRMALDALAQGEAAGFRPDVFLMAFISAAYSPGRDWIQTRFVIDPLNHFIPGVLLGLRWQFQGGTAQARAQEQHARAEVLRHLGAWAGQGIPAEVRRAYEDVLRAAKDIERGTEAVGKAKQWMVQAGADYSIGFLDVREVSDAVEAYVTLRTGLMKARFDHNVAMAALSKATGTLDGGADLFYLSIPETRTQPEVKP